jgi:hypothetical protein
MSGQTMMLCEGKAYHYDREHTQECGHSEDDPFDYRCKYVGTGHHYSMGCSGMLPGMPVKADEVLPGHGAIVYATDLHRYLLGLPVID